MMDCFCFIISDKFFGDFVSGCRTQWNIVIGKYSIFYLIAISEFDENNNAHSSKEEIVHCVNELSIFYDRYGDGHDIYIPLMGTGKSRAAVSLQESYDILVECYKNNPSRLQGNISIVIYKDFEEYVNI